MKFHEVWQPVMVPFLLWMRSGPLITTINDLVAVVVYYGLAMVVLIDLFHLG